MGLSPNIPLGLEVQLAFPLSLFPAARVWDAGIFCEILSPVLLALPRGGEVTRLEG